MCNALLLPVSVPGLRAVHLTTTELRIGMKEYHAIVRFERGQSEWWTRGEVHRSGPGSLQLMQPGGVHRDLAHDGPITFQVVVLPVEELERACDGGKVITHPHLAPGDERGLPFHRLHDAVAAFALMKSGTSEHTRPVRRAMEYLRERLADAVTLDELAHHAGLDKFHLCRAFRAQIGMPPHAYLTHLRVARAKRLLDRGVPASEVAPRVGLYDQSQLNRHFRRIVGTTPGRYGRTRLTPNIMS